MQSFHAWLHKLLGRWRRPQTVSPASSPVPSRPAHAARNRPATLGKDVIQAMPDFPLLPLDAITLVEDAAAVASACASLRQAGVLGFDSESKPTFNKGEHAQGPHLLQFSTAEHAWLFPLRAAQVPAPLRELLADPAVRKVGFDLRSDLAMLQGNYGVTCAGVLDLVSSFRAQGHRNTVGAVQAVALLFGQHYRKSKSAKMSNWAAPVLNDSQRRYAGNDAYVALRVYQALQAASQKAKP